MKKQYFLFVALLLFSCSGYKKQSGSYEGKIELQFYPSEYHLNNTTLKYDTVSVFDYYYYNYDMGDTIPLVPKLTSYVNLFEGRPNYSVGNKQSDFLIERLSKWQYKPSPPWQLNWAAVYKSDGNFNDTIGFVSNYDSVMYINGAYFLFNFPVADSFFLTNEWLYRK